MKMDENGRLPSFWEGFHFQGREAVTEEKHRHSVRLELTRQWVNKRHFGKLERLENLQVYCNCWGRHVWKCHT